MEASFGSHPYDRERAIKMLHLALCQGASMSDVIKEAKKHLKKWSSDTKFINYQVNLIKTFRPNPFKDELKKTKAWLITWEGLGVNNNSSSSQRIVNIFDSRVSAEKIKQFTEDYYIATQFNSFEKATFASNRKYNPYKAEFARINGIEWLGQIRCGHNPFLFARIVANLIVVFDKSAQEIVHWQELPVPQIPPI